MELPVFSFNGESHKVSVADAVFGAEYKEGVVHQVVTAYLSGARSGTKAQKTRSEVRGGGSKPWRQKGTGRSRAGSIRSPLWRGGGLAFAATPRDFSQKVNRKMYRRAVVSIISELIRQERFVVVDILELTKPKTRELKEFLKKSNVEKVLIVLGKKDRNVELAARNMFNVTTTNIMRVDPVSLVSAENVLITIDALKKLEEKLL
ncbi:50S ribosomal protein L4 [Coxiella endosymbiont of Amblyomma sculptum]|uniref:50S ribosomal protein L4 n=1 Tax=Coxiella endosymbiont of Amblyomma sculptum TaxID=2487929 RepID=UPI00132F1D63|nr:50S ribosomal protein L4 [Coxiella endosymbiont of Amblyomma sculptum]QHG92439.1 50S ribosomal protein L4 [Coxiella endosymbiont of Amblyomma sculptum]